jgi:hypothetical protein
MLVGCGVVFRDKLGEAETLLIPSGRLGSAGSRLVQNKSVLDKRLTD